MNLWRRTQVIVMTHTPGYWCEPGKIYVDGDQCRWVIKRLRRVGNTRLLDGGSAPCWEVIGVPARTDEAAA